MSSVTTDPEHDHAHAHAHDSDTETESEVAPSPYKENPWKQPPGERTAFGDKVRRMLGPPNRSTRAIPYLTVLLAVYIALSIWCQLYVSRHSTNDVIDRIDRLESTILSLKVTLRKDEARIETNRGATDARGEANRSQTTLQRMQEASRRTGKHAGRAREDPDDSESVVVSAHGVRDRPGGSDRHAHQMAWP